MFYRSFDQIGAYSSTVGNDIKHGHIMGKVKAIHDGEQFLLDEEDYYLKSKLIQYFNERV